MRRILILGAGRSAAALVRYLIDHAPSMDWQVTVADRTTAPAQELIGDGAAVARAVALDATDAGARSTLINAHDLTISMLPAFMHMDVLRDCLRYRKHVITPSYVPDALWAMHAEFKTSNLVVLNEMGLDPGIDHMSAMRILDRFRDQGAEVRAFESYCGGLVAPGSDDNLWGYKFSWNPRNVVLAGQGGAARFIENGVTRYTPYHRLFLDTLPVQVDGFGAFEGYPNRDSLKYRKHYGLEGIPTLKRGTLRKAGFPASWNVFVQLGCTEDGYQMELPTTATWSDYFNAFLPASGGPDTRARLASTLGLDPQGGIMARLDELGCFSNEPIGRDAASPAVLLQHLLEQRWVLRATDKDMVVMWHRFVYTLGGQHKELHASLGVIGNDMVHTAMARTVGLPIGIATKLLLSDRITERGVLLPLRSEIYDPVLNELETMGIRFHERELPANAPVAGH